MVMKKTTKKSLVVGVVFLVVCLVVGLTVYFVTKNKKSKSRSSAEAKENLAQLLQQQRDEIHQVLPEFEKSMQLLQVLISNNADVEKFKANTLDILEKQRTVAAVHSKHQQELSDATRYFSTQTQKDVANLINNQMVISSGMADNLSTSVEQMQKRNKDSTSADVMRIALWVLDAGDKLTALYRKQEAGLYTTGQNLLK